MMVAYLGVWLLLACSQTYAHAPTKDNGQRIKISNLIDNINTKLNAIQLLQEDIKKKLDEVRNLDEAAGDHIRADAPQASCDGTIYKLDHTSSFVSRDEVVTLNNEHTIRLDDILYGYDTVFEQRRIFSAGSWLGVQSQQDPSDLVVIQQIIWDVKPKVIYDIGTNVGGSAILFAHIMSQYAKPGEAVIVSVDPKDFHINWDKKNAARLCPRCTPVDENPLWGQYVRFVQAKSLDPPAIAALEGAINEFGGPVVISVDGWHDYREVFQECTQLAKYVTVGSYMIVQDTKLDRILKHAGPRRAVRNFLLNNTNFVSDRSREVFLYSQHTEGYLLRQS